MFQLCHGSMLGDTAHKIANQSVPAAGGPLTDATVTPATVK